MNSFRNFIEQSSDSLLLNYHYTDGQLSLYFENVELNHKYFISIPTKILSFDSTILGKEENLFKIFRIEIINLEQNLSSHKGYYTPNSDFGLFMKECKQNLNLAYGLKSIDCKFLFSLLGYGRLISCIVNDLDNIIFKTAN